MKKIFIIVLLIALAGGLSYWYLNKDAASSNPVQIANPASVNCTDAGGTLEIVNEESGQVGYCHLSSGLVCEEWAFFRNECGKEDARLYPQDMSVTWGPITATTAMGMAGSVATAVLATDTDNIAAASRPLMDYYARFLTSDGWTVDNSKAAGGPGAEIVAYQKGNEYVIVSLKTVFKGGGENEPVQCPCDVSLSVFSGHSADTE